MNKIKKYWVIIPIIGFFSFIIFSISYAADSILYQSDVFDVGHYGFVTGVDGDQITIGASGILKQITIWNRFLWPTDGEGVIVVKDVKGGTTLATSTPIYLYCSYQCDYENNNGGKGNPLYFVFSGENQIQLNAWESYWIGFEKYSGYVGIIGISYLSPEAYMTLTTTILAGDVQTNVAIIIPNDNQTDVTNFSHFWISLNPVGHETSTEISFKISTGVSSGVYENYEYYRPPALAYGSGTFYESIKRNTPFLNSTTYYSRAFMYDGVAQIAASPEISYTMSATQASATSTPITVEVIGQDYCGTSLLSLTDIMCNITNFITGIGDKIKGSIVAGYQSLIDAADNVFPINGFASINTAIQNATATTSIATLTIGDGDLFLGHTFKLLETSTMSNFESNVEYGIQNFIDKLIYLLTALVIVAISYLCYRIIKPKPPTE